MSDKNRIKKKHIVVKTIFQILLYLFEIISISGLCTWISFIVYPVCSCELFISVLERFALFYGFYQIIVYAVLNNINDIKADEYLALNTACEHALIACKYNDEKSKEQLIRTIESKQLSSTMFNDVSVREGYMRLITCIKDCNIPAIESLKITSNHNCEMSRLQWKLSFLLRCIK